MTDGSFGPSTPERPPSPHAITEDEVLTCPLGERSLMLRKLVTAVCTTLLGIGLVAGTSQAAEAANKTYKNCTALNKDYKHGVGKTGAKDKTSGTPVKNFKKSNSIYKKNKKSDRDKDGIACEKK